MWKAYDSGFVEIINDLGVQAVAIDGDRVEISVLFDQWTYQMRHVVLCSFKG